MDEAFTTAKVLFYNHSQCPVAKQSFKALKKKKKKNRHETLIFPLKNIRELSVGKQEHHFTAYWSCQHWQTEKCCHDLCRSCSRFGSGDSTDNRVRSTCSEKPHTDTSMNIK